MTLLEETRDDTLDEILKLTQENNRLLRGMHRRMLWSQIFTFVYWFIILGIAGWSYYYFQPYFNKSIATYQSALKGLESLSQQSKAFPSTVQNILDKVR